MTACRHSTTQRWPLAARTTAGLVLAFLAVGGIVAVTPARGEPAGQPGPASGPMSGLAAWRTFATQHCLGCHNQANAQGRLSLEDLTEATAKIPNASEDLPLDEVLGSLETWRLVREQIRFGLMPPPGKARPNSTLQAAVLAWLDRQLRRTQQPNVTPPARLLLPEFGNHIDHEPLFAEPAGPVRPPAPRVWRVRPEIYQQLMTQRAKGIRGLAQPFAVLPGEGFKDFAAAYFVDEPTTDLLLANAELVIAHQTGETRESVAALKALVDPRAPPTPQQVRAALIAEFQCAVRRQPTPDELSRFTELYRRNVAVGGHVVGGRETLVAVLVQPQAVFRLELGGGPPDALGRRRLSPTEIAVAVSYALGNHLDETLLAAALAGDPLPNARLAEHVRRRLDQGPTANSRLMTFFREYFGHHAAREVFKDRTPGWIHEPDVLVGDLDALIAGVLNEDRDVLRQLLTTNKAYVGYRVEAKTGKPMQAPNSNAVRGYLLAEYASVYGLPADWRWTPHQPVALPAKLRAGVLTHPAWLVAHSGNFENQPVQRGLWIRTRLLGGTVPDVPIGVDARIPEDPHKTLRQRLVTTTAHAECWRCHRKMDDLGLPFEMYSHLGRLRQREANTPIDTTGRIALTGDAHLDGSAPGQAATKTASNTPVGRTGKSLPALGQPVADPIELVHRLASSRRVEEVFVRHVFRFIMGRNETLGDAQTLQAAAAAYRNANGSMRALVASLLLSDSFLLRADPSPHGAANP